jgi:hypothetical protein
MQVLIVGCGAVGQVYGLFLQQAGVEVGLYDRPEASEKLSRALKSGGLRLYQVTYRHRREPVERRLTDYRMIRGLKEARAFAPDQIWFTVPSPAYYTDWFRDFLQAVPSRRVVCFIPEGRRPEFMPKGAGERFVFGGTAFMAWQGGPEAGGGRPDGINFWRAPLGIPLAGTREGCREAGLVLKKAGFGYTAEAPDSRTQACITAAMTVFMAGLELAGWSLREYRRSPWRGRAAAACREAVLGQLPAAGALQKALLGTRVLSAAFYLVGVFLPLLVPFDLEKYLKFHYTKTREQTLVLLEMFAGDGEKRNLPVDTIRRIQRAMRGG